MARPKFQVFVSSTYSDLHQERQAAVWEILKARHIPAGMEAFPATDDRGWDVIQRTIDDSDYYVVLVAGRYGSEDPATKMSWTEREYEYARSKGIPVLAFLRDKAFITANNMDVDGAAKKLEAFVQKLSSNHLYKRWTTAEDLRSHVQVALGRAIEDAEDAGRPRPGWVRGGTADADALVEMTRLSKENAALREQLVALGGAQKARLKLTLNGKEAPSELEESIPELSPGADLPRQDDEDDHWATLRRASRTLWLVPELENVGTAPARNVRARFTVRRSVVGLDLGRTQRIKVDDFAHSPPSRLLDPTRDLYVESDTCRDGVAVVEQRIRTLGVGQDERFITMGLVLDGSEADDEPVLLEVDYKIRAEDGASCAGTVKVTVTRGESEVISKAEYERL